jgi:ketopantoate hydroxymethyltransferase
MCLECVELLCSECIGEHLELHREANCIPKIMSIRQLRGEMEGKIEHIIGIMDTQNPNALEVEGLRKHVAEKIDSMRRDLIRAV